MRNSIIIIVCIALGFLFAMYVWDNKALVVNKHYNYFGCKVSYKHAFLVTGFNRLNRNIWAEKSARCTLMRCLCDKYETTKDSAIGKFIIDFCNSDSRIQQIYVNEVLLNTIDTSILVAYCEDIYKNKRSILDKLKGYRNRQELKQIVTENLFDNVNEEFNYNQLIHRLPITSPKIDTVIKYKEVLFKEPILYGGE